MRILALDVGTSSVRSLLYDGDGRIAEGVGAQERYTATRGHSGRLGVFDAEELVALSRDVLAEGRREARSLDAVAISSFWHSLVAVDAAGRPLTGVLTWRDNRSAGDAARLTQRVEAAAVHARTGCPVHPSFWPAKLAWLRREEPETFAAAARFVSFPDLLVDRARTSISMASGTGLLGTRTLAWDAELLDELGLDPSRLPMLDGDPALPIGDGAASNLGTGARVTLSVGTSGALRVLASGEPEPKPGLFLLRLDRERFLEGGSLSDGGNLHDWLQRTLRPGSESPASRPPGANRVTFLTLLGGERSPGWHAHASGAVAGLTFETTSDDLVQAAVEGVAFRFAEVADRLGLGAEPVTVTGKATENGDWLQILADVLERPIVRSGAGEASARGAAVYALEHLGVHAPPPADGPTFEPRSDRFAALREARERQRALYAALVVER